MAYLGIDVGGTKIAAGVVDSEGTVLDRLQVPTPEGTADAVFAAITECVRQLDTAVDGVGVASAGPVDLRAGTVSPVNIAEWRGFPLRDRVAELFPHIPVELAGDGVCMALGEHWTGAGQGVADLLGLVVSTGVGGGLVLGGRGYPGRTGNAGHIGHMAVATEPACPCGGLGCVEVRASGPNIVAWAKAQGWAAPADADGKALADGARAGDEIALAAFARSGQAVGMAIAAAAVLFDLELAIVGGGLAQAGDLLFDPIRAAVATHAKLSYVSDLRVVAAEHTKDAGIVGAASLVARPATTPTPPE
ncbi:Sugar kinase [Alloactinosynnema sp. L-07]|uniref:ROK family protein n=1 Tax=Alloactinosynnema sp. L-07 TaxID=1653480 RepID=UPI00065F091C|nr:ROK family protein [Alloactinosynnema sp. L-07]CRK60605.1 Sugar kinase [Alloactinosynnema sp. L-07]